MKYVFAGGSTDKYLTLGILNGNWLANKASLYLG